MTEAPPNGRPADMDGAKVPPARRRRRLLPGLAVILLLAVFAAGVVLAPRIMGALPAWLTGGDTPRTVAALPPPESSETPVTPPAEQAAPSANMPVPVPDVGDFARQLADLQSQVDRLQGEEDADSETAEAVTSMGAQIAHMLNQLAEQQQRLSALEETSPRALLKPMAVLAVARLRQAAEQGSSYQGALGGVGALIEGQVLPDATTTALATLAAHEKQGVPSAMALRDAFDARIEDIIEADAAPADASWWERTWARARNLVTVRPTGEVAGQDAPAIVARAETALDRGDVDRAVEELQGLSPKAALAAADWLRLAQDRQAVLAAIDTLETTLLAETAIDDGGMTP
ncbi:MAG: COG4223 family protein [Sphingomonadales bacterium]